MSDEDRSVFEGIATATVLKPGDRVIITLRDGYAWTREQLSEIRAEFQARLPDVQFVIVANGATVSVVPAEGEATDG